MALALHRGLETYLQNALNLGPGIDVGIVGHVVVLMSFAEVHPPCQFADNNKIYPLQEFVFQRAFVQQAVEGGYRTDVGKESQFLAHGQQTLLGAHGRGGVVVVFQVANGGEEYGVGPHTYLMGTLGIRVAHLVDGMGAADGLLVAELMVELTGNGIHHVDALLHDFRSDTVAGKNGYS